MSCNTFGRNLTRCDIMPVPREDFTEAAIIDLEAYQAKRKAHEEAIIESNRVAADMARRKAAYPHSNELRTLQKARERQAAEERVRVSELAARPWWRRALGI